MITLLAFVFVLGVLVFVHELGHFLAAKRVGIRVLKFQLGFNPTIVSFQPRRHRIRHRRAAARRLREDGWREPRRGRARRARQTDRHADEFLAKTKWERFQVLIMGPTMNLLLAVVLTAVVLYHGARAPLYEDQPVVVGVVTEGSPAAKAGIQPGDRIVSVAERHASTPGSSSTIAVGNAAESRSLDRAAAQRASGDPHR